MAILPRGDVRIKKELTGTGGYGSDPTLAASNAKYVEEWQGRAQLQMEQRSGLSAFAPGFPQRVVGQENLLSATFEVGTFEVPTTDTGARPELDEALAMGLCKDLGWTADGLGAGKDTQIYELQSSDFAPTASVASSVAIEERFFEPDGSDGVGWQYLGCRSDWQLAIEPGGIWRMSHSIMAKTGTPLTGLSRSGVTLAHDCVLTSSKAVVTIEDVAAQGYSINRVLSATLAANSGVVARGGLHGGLGPAYIGALGTGPTLQMQVEQEPDDQFPWYDLMNTCATTSTPNAFRVLITGINGTNQLALASGIASNALVGMYFALSDVEPVADVDGRRVWNLSFANLYPETAVGAEDAGLTQGESIQWIFSNGA